MGSQETDHKQLVREAVLDEATFIRLTLTAQINGAEMPWRRIVIRPVLIKQKRHLQISYFDARQDTTKNYRGDEAAARLDEVLRLPFKSLHVETTTDDLRIQAARGGKVTIQRSGPAEDRAAPDLAHDASKNLPFPVDRPDPYLQSMGVMDAQGKIKPGMHDKFSQVNEFIKLLEHSGELDNLYDGIRPLRILDCGCGSSYLTFGVYHYLNHVRNMPTEMIGIDVKQWLIDKSIAQAEALNANNINFCCSPIISYEPDIAPDIVIALHACDTATDDAIAQAIRLEARLILCAPCCHHDLNQQLQSVPPFQPVFRHGILKERMADILTDTFRALALRIMGYKTDVIEFVSSEHTNRNLMIRAVKRSQPGDKDCLQEYNALKTFWSVTPYIEKLLIDFGRWPERAPE